MFKAMNLTDLANKYKVSVKTLKKWMKHFCPEVQLPQNCETYTPDQVKNIVNACGEFPN